MPANGDRAGPAEADGDDEAPPIDPRDVDARIASAVWTAYGVPGHHVTCEARIGRGIELETGDRGAPHRDVAGPLILLHRPDGTPLGFSLHPRLFDEHGARDREFDRGVGRARDRVRTLLLDARRAGPPRRLRPPNRLRITVRPDGSHVGGFLRDDRLALRLLVQRIRRALGLVPLRDPRTHRRDEIARITADLRAAVDGPSTLAAAMPGVDPAAATVRFVDSAEHAADPPSRASRTEVDPDGLHALPRSEWPLRAAVARVVHERWNPTRSGERRDGMNLRHLDREREVFALARDGAPVDAIRARLARADGAAPEPMSRGWLDRRAAQAIVSARARLERDERERDVRYADPWCVRGDRYRSVAHSTGRAGGEIAQMWFHLERRLPPAELGRALCRVLGFGPNLARSVPREAWIERQGLWSGGVDVVWHHPASGFGTCCELLCDVDEPTGLDVLVALSALLGTRALVGAPDHDASWQHLVRPDGAVSSVRLHNVPVYEDDLPAVLGRLDDPQPWFLGRREAFDRPVPALLRELTRRVREAVPPDWTRARIELACGGSERPDGWLRELFADVRIADGTRFLELNDPTSVRQVLERIGEALAGDGPVTRHLLVEFEPDAEPRVTLPRPAESAGPSTVRFRPRRTG